MVEKDKVERFKKAIISSYICIFSLIMVEKDETERFKKALISSYMYFSHQQSIDNIHFIKKKKKRIVNVHSPCCRTGFSIKIAKLEPINNMTLQFFFLISIRVNFVRFLYFKFIKEYTHISD
jgi:hypothetical protein